ncbi:hypothetical protein [Rothia aeria]|uniref:hypothetical protein n=1 Tax=Rothia aeria TaxID=172042 RepID=UPI00242F54D1|nr:hypothetical protein [Rothia aeria]
MATTELFGSVSEVLLPTRGGVRYAESGRTFVSGVLTAALQERLKAPRVLLVEVPSRSDEDLQQIRGRAKTLKSVPVPPQILKPAVFPEVTLDDGSVIRTAGYPLNGELLSEIPDLTARFGVRAANALLISLAESVVKLPMEASGSESGPVHGGISPERVIIPAPGSGVAIQLAGLGVYRQPESPKQLQDLMRQDTQGLRAIGRVLPISVALAAECVPSRPGSKPSSLVNALQSAVKREGDAPTAQVAPSEMADFAPPAPVKPADFVAPSAPRQEKKAEAPAPAPEAPAPAPEAPAPAVEEKQEEPKERMVKDPSGYGLVAADSAAAVVPKDEEPSPVAQRPELPKPAQVQAPAQRMPEEIPPAAPETPVNTQEATASAPEAHTPTETAHSSMLNRIRGVIPTRQPREEAKQSTETEQRSVKALLTRRNLLAGGAGVGVLLLGSLAVGAMGNKKSKDTSNDEVRSVSTLTGYADSGTWTVPVSASAQVFAAEAGVLVANGPKVEIHAFSKPAGKTLVRTVDLGGELDLAFDTQVGGKAALVMQSGRKLTVFVEGMGAEDKLIEAEVREGARISGSGSATAVLAGSSASVLLRDGLAEFKRPEESAYSSLAADSEGLISVAFDAPVLVTDREGKKLTTASLSAVAEGWGVHSWIGAGHGKIVSLWAQDVYTQDEAAEVVLAVHSATDGSLLGQKQMRLSDAAEKTSNGMTVRPLRVGQGGKTAVFGRSVIRLADGSFRDDLPADAAVKKIKGEVIVTEDQSGSALVYAPAEARGVKFSGAIMAQVSSGLLVQRGNALILLPGNQA